MLNWLADWAEAIEAFPSIKNDARSATDSWALGHPDGAVFYLMRILERGLAALAADVGVEMGVKNWQNIIEQIEARIRDLSKTLPTGPDRIARLGFLSEGAKEFIYFKDGWRNHSAHSRTSYDQHQARSAMEHVRQFMIVLSARLRESPEPDE